MGCICLRAARGALLLALVVCLCFPARAAVWVEGMELDIELPSGKTIQDNPGGSRIDVGGAQYTVLDGGVELFSTVKATVESTNSYYHILLTRSYLDSLSAEVRRFLVGQIQFRHLENSSGLSSIVVLEDNDRDGTFTLARILFAALLGTALGVGYTLFRLYFSVPAAVDAVVKYGVALALPLPAAKFRTRRACALCCMAFVAYMAAFAGILTALFPAQAEGETGGVVFVAESIPSGVLVAGCVLFAFAAVRVVRLLASRARAGSLTYPCVLRLGEREVKAKGFADTGNRLTDARGQGVVVADRLAALALVRGQSPPREQIEVTTVGGKTLLTAFRIDEIKIYCGGGENIIKDVTVAVSAHPIAGEYGLILPAAFAGPGGRKERC